MYLWEFSRPAEGASLLLAAWTLLCWLPLRLNGQDVIFPGNPRFPVPSPHAHNNLQQSCFPQDSCQVRGNSRDTLLTDKRSCYCDYACAEYGDCCRDSRFYSVDSAMNGARKWKCTNLRNYYGIYLKVACPTWWSDTDIRRQCEIEDGDERDPFLRMPVTSRTTQLTYRNYFCAICNKDIASPIFWLPHLECGNTAGELNFTVEEFWDLVQYRENVRSWGIVTENNSFVTCSVDPEMPLNVEDMVRRCVPFVSNCSANWTDFGTMQQCTSYTTYVYEGEKVYRNWDCAKCNYAESLICTRLLSRKGATKFNSNIFTVLFDVNGQHGQQVGQIKRCDDSEIYDPFARRCRSIICGRPDQVFRAGRCIADPESVTADKTTTETLKTEPNPPVTSNMDITRITTPSWHYSNETSEPDVLIFPLEGEFSSERQGNFTERMDFTSKETLPTTNTSISMSTPNTNERLTSSATVSFNEGIERTSSPHQEHQFSGNVSYKNDSFVVVTPKSFGNSTMSFYFPSDLLNNSLHDLNTDVLQTNLTYEILTAEEDENNRTPPSNSSWNIANVTSSYDVKVTPAYNITNNHKNDNTLQSSVNESASLQCEQFELNSTEYRFLENGSVYVHVYKRILMLNEFRYENKKMFVCAKSLLGSEYSNYEQKFSGYLAVVALVGLGISLVCLLLHLAAFCLVPELRNLSGNNLASLCIALIVAYSMFILAQFNSSPSIFCRVIAIAMYYAFLSSFFWMNTMAFDVWRALKQATTELRISSGIQWQKFLIYSAYSWLSPLLIVASSLIVENIPSVPNDLRPAFGSNLCWFNHRRALLLFFVVPIVTIIISNVILFSFSAYMIVSTTRSSAKLHTSKSQRTFRLYLRLALLMGLTWIIGIVAAAADVDPLWYVFVAFNTLQGLFIFFAFTCTKKVIQSVLARVSSQPRLIRKTSTFADSSSEPRITKKSGLEARDSADSQSSNTSQSSLTQTSSVRSSNASVDALY